MNASVSDSPLLAELLKSGRLTPEVISNIPDAVKQADLETYLIAEKLVTDAEIVEAYAALYHLPFVRLSTRVIDPTVLRLIPELIARRYDVVAYQKEGDIVHVALSAPKRMVQTGNVGLLKRLQQELNLRIAPAFAPLSEIRQAFAGYNAREDEKDSNSGASQASKSESVNLAVQVIPKEVSFDGLSIVPDVLATFPYEVAKRYQVVPFAKPKIGALSVAARNPDDPTLRELLQFVQSRNALAITVYPVNEANFALALSQYQVKSAAAPSVGDIGAPQQGTIQPVDDLPVATRTEQIIPEIKSEEVSTLSTAPKAFDPERYHSSLPSENLIITNQNTENILESYFAKEPRQVNDVIEIVQSGNIPRVVAGSIAYAIILRASDIHIEAAKEKVRLRYRIDGELTDILYLPRVMLAPLVSRVKILAQMKIDENRVPQDGRFNVSFHGREIDIRVSTLPTIHGEKVVMRILDRAAGVMTLADMGLDGTNLKRVESSMNKAYGMLLATGPTGSGKTTTLYAIMQQISKPEVNVVTIEDPVEYELPGINQTQIKPKIGFNFADGLRSILRQDPNVIMVGEIRDKETAEMATQAALTGHLVLSTLHTNNSSGAMPRLVDMGIEPFLITSSVNAVIGQRLVRRICPDCKQVAKLPEAVLTKIANELAIANVASELKDQTKWQIVAAKGCAKCHSGYRGRIGLFEILTLSETIESLVVKGESASVIESAAVKEGMITLKQDGLAKVVTGLTTLEEVLKATEE